MNQDEEYIPMNRGVAYDDMTPEEKQAYHERIAAVRKPGYEGFVSLGQILQDIIDSWVDGNWEDAA